MIQNFNTKVCPEDLVFGDFNNQLTPFTYTGLINDYDDDGTPIGATPMDKELVEDKVVTNDEDNNNKITTRDDILEIN